MYPTKQVNANIRLNNKLMENLLIILIILLTHVNEYLYVLNYDKNHISILNTQ